MSRRKAGGKPSTWLPPGGLVERSHENTKITKMNTNPTQTQTIMQHATYRSNTAKKLLQHRNGGQRCQIWKNIPPLARNTDEHELTNDHSQTKQASTTHVQSQAPKINGYRIKQLNSNSLQLFIRTLTTHWPKQNTQPTSTACKYKNADCTQRNSNRAKQQKTENNNNTNNNNNNQTGATIENHWTADAHEMSQWKTCANNKTQTRTYWKQTTNHSTTTKQRQTTSKATH